MTDLTGQVFERLTVLGRGAQGAAHDSYWLCRCVCGGLGTFPRGNLTRGKSRSCGCLRREMAGGKNLTHGARHSVEYNAWCRMKGRCYNVKNPDYAAYGGRGITVCPRWRASFAAFLADVGPRPSPSHSIDRFPNNDGPYAPENVRWATPKEQANNRRRAA